MEPIDEQQMLIRYGRKPIAVIVADSRCAVGPTELMGHTFADVGAYLATARTFLALGLCSLAQQGLPNHNLGRPSCSTHYASAQDGLGIGMRYNQSGAGLAPSR